MAARSIWKGIITFGMVSIPIKVYSGTESKDISFRQLHNECKGRIKQQTFCPACDRNVEYAELTKGYEYGKDQYVVVDKDDFEKLPLPNKNSIDVTNFVTSDAIDSPHYDQTYYVEPEDAAKKPFALFMKAMTEKNVIAIGKIAIRTKERLCALRPIGGTLVMNTLLYPDEIRIDLHKPMSDIEVNDKELAMAGSLIDMMTDDFEPEKYTDNYREALLKLIEAKVEGREIEVAPQAKEGTVVDLMAALQASMESLKAEKAKDGGKKLAAVKDEPKEMVATAAKAAKTAAEPKIGVEPKTRKKKTG
jgi:Ku protein, prokaryotic